MAQVANTDHNEVVVIVHAQDMADLSAQLLHVVAVALLAEFAEAAEILADLRGGDVHLLSQGVGRDAHDAAVAKFRQLAVIAGQTADHSIRYIFFLQEAPSLLK